MNLELLSGSDRIAAALRRQVKNVISFGVDISQGACLDLTRENIQQVIIKFICRFHEFVWLGHLAIPGAMLADGMEEDLGH